MLEEILFRFAIGGVVVAAFATLGDLFKPKSFAGLFGAAPSVALATLGMAVVTKGRLYAATEARSMMGGALALLVYTLSVSWILMRYKRGGLGRNNCSDSLMACYCPCGLAHLPAIGITLWCDSIFRHSVRSDGTSTPFAFSSAG